jgi:DNA-binding transcriptional ArsR family regulator
MTETTLEDQVWAAIGDPTRRKVLDVLLSLGPSSASVIGRELPVTRQAVSKHLAMLESAGLVTTMKVGRELKYEIDADQFARAVSQLAAVERQWIGRLKHIGAIAEAMQRGQVD